MAAKSATIVLICGAAVLAGCARQEEAAANQAESAANQAASKPPQSVTAEDEGLPCTYAGTDAAYREWQQSEQAAKAGADPSVRNILVVEGGDSYRWNDSPVDRTRLRQYLDITHTMAPTPWLIVQRGAGADEAAVERARELIYLSLDCRAEF